MLLLQDRMNLVGYSGGDLRCGSRKLRDCIRLQYTTVSQLDSFNIVSLVPHSFGGYKSKIKVTAKLVPFWGWEEELVPCLSPSFW
jgi:hypothetical protein